MSPSEAASVTIERMDDRRVGRILREIRIRRGWRQTDLATRAHVSQSQVSQAELGRMEHVALGTLRRIGNALGVRVSVDAWWPDGRIDQLLDRAHAAIVEATVGDLQADGYETRVEYGFSEYGERGSVDVLGWRGDDRSLVVTECKSRIDDVQATASAFGRKLRLLPGIVRRDEGWDPARTVGLLVLVDTHQNRDIVRRHRATFRAIWPLGTVDIRRAIAGRGAEDAAGIRFLARDRSVATAMAPARVRPR